MKVLYIECNMGVAGDMLMSSLLELSDNRAGFIDKMNNLKIPGVDFSAEYSNKCGIMGTHVCVKVKGEEETSKDIHNRHNHNHNHHHDHNHDDHKHSHHHTQLKDINEIINALNVSEKVKNDAKNIYQLIAEAEGAVHGEKPEYIHFHEVGSLDAVADIVGVCVLMEELQPDRIVASSIHVGSGQVKCAHGILPVPAPATANILQGISIYGGEIQGELCTPTGAALIKYFASEIGNIPTMNIEKIGYGMGNKDFERANCVRCIVGEADRENLEGDKVIELACNLDDMTGEAIGFATDVLFEAGALDVYTTPITMKKSRPGIILSCLCKPEDKRLMTSLIFKHTTTIGIRQYECNRQLLKRYEEEILTEYGPVRVKKVSGYGVSREKAEYDDLAQIAKRENISIADIKLK